ncbi:hypothetical protein M378DRAFT_74661, partial [Amanita muscaria Koide BX008]
IWIMGYQEAMGYKPDFGCNQLGNTKKLWEVRSYGKLGLWVRRSSTVYISLSMGVETRCKVPTTTREPKLRLH